MPPSTWNCSRCTFTNEKDLTSCAICLYEKPSNAHSNIDTLVNSTSPLDLLTLFKTRLSLSSALTSIYQSTVVRERRRGNKTEAENLFQTIIAKCRRKGKHFVDTEFPPSASSLGGTFSSSVSQWLRVEKIRPSGDDDRASSNWTVMSSSPSPADVEQGLLGNCWLVAALALITERPKMLQHILLTREINPEGVYLVRLCHNGRWKTLVIDDSFPCSQHGTLLFSKARGRQLYIPLIEKACAKLFGSYSNLTSGLLQEGLELFTGAPCDHLDLQATDEPIDENLIWGKILSYSHANLLMGTSTGRRDVTQANYDQVKIHGNHAFSILAVHALDRDSKRFLLLRDPHARSCYTDPDITEPILARLRLVNGAKRGTGAFWIEWKSFLRYFESITISTYVTDHYDIRQEARFNRSPTDPISAFYFEVPQTSSITISIHPHLRSRHTTETITRAFVLRNVSQESTGNDQNQFILFSQRQNHIHWSGSLRPGCYCLIPFSISFWRRHRTGHDDGQEFTLVIHSTVNIQGILGDETSTFLADSLIAAVMKTGRRLEKFENTNLYATDKEQSLTVLVAENRSTTHHFNIDMNTTGSNNIHHSRNTVISHDSIPPSCRQILAIIEWINPVGHGGNFVYKYSLQVSKSSKETFPAIENVKSNIHAPRHI